MVAPNSKGLGQVDTVGTDPTPFILGGLALLTLYFFWSTSEGSSSGRVTRKQGVYKKTKGSGSISSAMSAAYSAGKRSGDSGNFDSWLESKGLDGRGSGVIARLQKQYEKGVEGESKGGSRSHAEGDESPSGKVWYKGAWRSRDYAEDAGLLD